MAARVVPLEGPPEQAGAHYKCITLGSEDIPSPARDGGAGLGLGQEHEQVLEVPQLMPLFQAARTVLSGNSAIEVIVLAALVGSASGEHMNETGTSVAYILFLLSIEILFMLSVFKVFERRLREIFYYKMLRYHLVIDFWNVDERIDANLSLVTKSFKKAQTVLSSKTGYLQWSTAVVFTMCCSATYIMYRAARVAGTGVAWISLFGTVFVVIGSADTLQKPFRDVETLEEHLISLSKFIDCNPNKARQLIQRFKVQSEDVTFRRLADIINLQQEALFTMAWKPWAKSRSLEPSNKEGLLEQIKARAERDVAEKELNALYKETIERQDFPTFDWNQLRTNHLEQFSYGKSKPKLHLCTWKSGKPEYMSKKLNFSIAVGMTGRYYKAYTSLIFANEEDRKDAKAYRMKVLGAYSFFAFCFVLIFARAMAAAEGARR